MNSHTKAPQTLNDFTQNQLLVLLAMKATCGDNGEDFWTSDMIEKASRLKRNQVRDSIGELINLGMLQPIFGGEIRTNVICRDILDAQEMSEEHYFIVTQMMYGFWVGDKVTAQPNNPTFAHEMYQKGEVVGYTKNHNVKVKTRQGIKMFSPVNVTLRNYFTTNSFKHAEKRQEAKGVSCGSDYVIVITINKVNIHVKDCFYAFHCMKKNEAVKGDVHTRADGGIFRIEEIIEPVSIKSESILSNVQLERIKNDYSKKAGEVIDIELIGCDLFIYGSELACLRLFWNLKKRYPNSEVDAGYSENKKTWYFKSISISV